MRSQIGGPKAMPPVSLRRLPGGFHSVAKQASFNVAVGTDFRGTRRPKWTPKVDLRAFFSMLFWNAFWYQILIDFWRLRTRKIAILFEENNDFCKIGVFDKGTKKYGFGLHFGRPNQRKFDPKSFQKIAFL